MIQQLTWMQLTEASAGLLYCNETPTNTRKNQTVGTKVPLQGDLDQIACWLLLIDSSGL